MKTHDSMMPSYEVIIKRDTLYFDIAWNACKQPLYKYAKNYMEKQQKPLKLRVGCEFTIIKVKELREDMNIFLEDDKKCFIHKNYGVEALSFVCRTYPRYEGWFGSYLGKFFMWLTAMA